MFSSKKKVKSKDSVNQKDPNKKITRNISKQFKNLIGKKKQCDVDNISQVTSVDSNTDNSIRSSFLESSIICKVINDTHSMDEDIEDKNLVFPTWYKQPLHLPQCKPLSSETSILLNISRTLYGDFGFVLRKGSQVERFTNEDGYFNELKNLAIFAEPVNVTRENMLLPGDKLIEVNNIDLQNRLREEIIDIIKSCGNVVKLTIQPSPECLEFSFRRFTNLSNDHVNIRSWIREKKSFSGIYKELYNKVVNNFESVSTSKLLIKDKENSNLEEKVWINFNEGFAAGIVTKKLGGGKCLLKLLINNSEIEVSEEDIHRANPSTYDLEENVVLLPHLNESSLVHNIRQRFSNNLIHTFVGKHILYINPMNTFNCYSEKAMYLFKSANAEDIPPHVYSTAQNTFQNLKAKKENQSICILGRSGSGKSMVLKHLVHYFACITTNNSNATRTNITSESIQALWILLDAFTCTRTGINTNASRCGKRVSLNFSHVNHNLVLTGLNLQIFLLDVNRIFRRPEREPSFHIFYHFLAGINAKQTQVYNLRSLNESNSFMTPLQRESEKNSAAEQWDMVCQAAFLLGISENEWDVVCRVLATIVHLGAAKTTHYQQQNSNSSSGINNNRICGRFLNKDAAKRAADTLNCSEEALHRAVFEYYKQDLQRNKDDKSSARSDDGSTINNQYGIMYNSQDLLNGFVSGLYFEVVEMIIFFINRYFNSSYSRVINSVIIVDPPGFQVPTSYNKNHVGIYEDLLFNYAYERLLNLNYTYNINDQKKSIFNKENVNGADEQMFEETGEQNQILTTLDGDCKAEMFDTIGKKGLLNYIESEALVGNEMTLIKKLHVLFQSHHKLYPDKKKRILKSICVKTGDFTISHCNLSQPLKYNVMDGLKYSRELPTFSSSEVLLSMCHNDTIQDILTSLSKSQNEAMSMKHSNKSVLAHNKLEMNDVINSLTQTNDLSFIYCISSIPNAGLCQLKDSIDKHLFDENVTCGGLFSVPLVKIQLQSFQILQILRLMKFGYPESLTFDNFFYIIKNIVPASELKDSIIQDADSIIRILNYLKINSKRYRIGDNELFFRLGTVFDLKNSKDLASTAFIIKFQSLCRVHLAKKKVEKLKLQHEAARIIQRNASTYLKIREWSWWKLYSRIRPLIGVIRIDEELKNMKDTVTQLRTKNLELESEKEKFKKEERQYENTLDDLKNEAVMYRQKIQKLTCVLEDKEKNQVLLEKQIDELQEEMIEYNDKILLLENDLKNYKAESVQQDDVSNHYNDNRQNTNKEDYRDYNVEKLIRESKSQKEEIAIELEKTKKLCDNLKLELEDVKYQAETGVTTEELERKLKSYEREIKNLQKTITDENSYREHLKRENHKVLSEKSVLEKELMEVKREMLKNASMSQINSKPDYSNIGNEDREYSFKKHKLEYENRIRELEEEIDEVNDNYDLVQQEKIKLRLQIEKLNQEKINELNDKEEEIEHIKASCVKKIKNLELQLEEDSLKRQSLVREKREADRIIIELKQNMEIQRDLNLEKKLKRELKTTKDALNDALDQIEDLKCRKENKLEIKELRDKLDDAEHFNEILVKQKSGRERELEECHQEIENLTNSKQELETKLKQTKSDIFNLQNQVEDLESQIEQSDRKNQLFQNQISALNDGKINLNDRLESLESENKKMKSTIDKMEQNAKLINNDLIEKSEYIKLQSKLSDLEMKMHYEDSTKTRLQTFNEKLKDQLFEAQSDKERFQNQQSIDQERVKKLEKQIKEYRLREDMQTKEISELKNKIKTLTEKNMDMEEEMEKNSQENSLSKQRIQRLEQMLENYDDDNSDHSFSDILSKADSMIKSRKFSVDQNSVHRSHQDSTNRRSSLSSDRFSTHFSDDQKY